MTTAFATAAADANATRIAAIVEATFGTTPATPTWDTMRLTSEGLGQDTETVQSQELRTDRGIADIIRTSVSVSGDIGFELSIGGLLETFIAAVFSSTGFSSPVTATSSADYDFSAPSNGVVTIDDNLSSGYGSFVAGQWVKISGSLDAVNNGVFKILTVPTSSQITIVNPNGIAATGEAGVTMIMLAQVVPGTDFKSYTIEKTATDIASAIEYERLLGCAINTLSLDIPTNGVVTGAFGILGSSSETATAEIASSTYNAATTSPILNSIDNIIAVYLQIGTTHSVQGATNFTFNMTNNLRARQEIGTLGAVSMGQGTFGFEGTLQTYLASKNLLDEALEFNDVSLSVVAQDSDGNGYVFDFPRCKLTNGRAAAGGINTDVIADFTFMSYLDDTESIMARVSKF